jgi:hypothetical protein
MMKKTGIAVTFLLFAFAALSAAGQSQDAPDKSADKTADKSADKNADKAQIVATAEILKIDAKKKTLDVRNVVQSSSTGDGASRPSNGPSTNGQPGGRRRQGGIGFPGGGGNGGGRPYPGGGPSVVTNQPKEYKVFVTNDTVLKLFNATIDFSDLHVSDRIAVSGVQKGKNSDLEATTITRDPPQ